MKKLAFLVVLVAVIVGIVFGSISIASATRPTPTPVVNPCNEMLERIYALDQKVTGLQNELANVTRMETISGVGNGTSGGKVFVEERYPDIRHVSLTIEYDHILDFNDRVNIIGLVDCSSVIPYSECYVFGKEWTPPQPSGGFGSANVQFDAQHWSLFARDEGPSPDKVWISYAATVTY